MGTHDFAAVSSVGTDVKSTVRTVYYYNVERQGELVTLRVCANGFLYNMARAMAGTVVYAAEGKDTPGGDRRNSGLRQPHRRRPDSPGGRAVHDPSVV